jgi:hypothetical protein
MRRLRGLVLLAATALAGCGESHLVGSLVYMEPYRFETFDCAELKRRAATAASQRHAKEKLIDKASESAAGVVIGNMVHGPERSKAHWEQNLYEREAARKNCDPPPEPPPPQQISPAQ